MKVAFVLPYLMSSKTFLQPPIEFYTAKRMLLCEEIEADVYDFRITKPTSDEAVNIICKENYDLIVATTSPYDMCQMYHSDYRLTYAIHVIKKIAEAVNAPLLLAGAHGNLLPENMLKETNADYIIVGEIEKTVLNAARAVKNGEDLRSIPNLIYLTESGHVQTEYKEEYAYPDANELGEADWSCVDFSKYFGYYYVNGKMRPKSNWGVVLGSRGCSFNCAFCYNFFGRKIRFRSVESIVAELHKLKEQGCELVFFLDMIFTVNHSWTTKLCELIIKENLGLKWICQTRCDCITPELLLLMKEAGCYAIQYGVESFDDEVLKGLNKQLDCKTIMNALCATRDADIIPSAFLMVGTPFDTVHSLKNTIAMLEKEKIPFIPIIYTPRYGSVLGNQIAEEKGNEGWQAMLALRGNLADKSNIIDMIKNHSVMKGESFNTVNVNFKNKEFSSINETHRVPIFNSKVIEEGKALEDYVVSPEGKGEDFVPFLSFPITHSCPFKCIYCGEGGENTISNVSMTDLTTIIDLCTKAKRLGIKKVRLTGGEPLTHPQIADILRYLSEEGFYVLVNTNGLLLEKKRDILMRTSKNIHFAVSLDTLKRDRFKLISQTTEENFDTVLRGVELLRELGYLMRINMVVGKFNVDEVPDMIEFCRQNGCDLKLQEIASVPYPHLKWEDIHCDFKDIEKYLEGNASRVLVHEYASKIGIPVKIYDMNNVYVTLKAMYYGSRYETKEFCKNCPHFPCHEGLYDVYVLGDGSVATCRWRRFGSFDSFEDDLKKTIEIFKNAEYIGHNNVMRMERVAEKGNNIL